MTVRRRTRVEFDRLEGRELLSGLQQDVAKLVQDLSAIHQGSNVTPAEIKAVGTDLSAIAKVATKPDPKTVATLKTDVAAAASDGVITPAEAVKLEKDVSAVLVSANIPKSLAQQTAADVKTLVIASGVTKQQVKVILGDVQAILADLGTLKK
ncbi:hypothetical protein [Paludisphaera rhizosphaerae]|uniref:hypothetical protein n=1 Tax=Paludisphaera rhizosphaerae TaxID=2711216 RepID=UPI0013ED5A90|nr:hypothetical protein [Paludisphaera rhizosphaerae]